MKFLTKNFRCFPIGVWIAIVALVLTLLAWSMQLYSLINWEGAMEIGLQSESFNGDPVERTLAHHERGLALADVVWPLPLTIIALIGVFRKRQFGLVAAMMDFSVCIYFPLFWAFQRWNTHTMTAISAIILFAIPSLLGIYGLWMNRKIFTA